MHPPKCTKVQAKSGGELWDKEPRESVDAGTIEPHFGAKARKL